MRTCTLIFTLCLFSTLQVKGQKTIGQKINEDTLAINDMLDDVEGYKKVDVLEAIVEEYKDYWTGKIDTVQNEQKLQLFYEKIGGKLLKISPKYNADFNERLIDLKKEYSHIQSQKKYNSLNKRLSKLKRKHKKNKLSTIEKLKIVNWLKKYDRAGGKQNISIGDIVELIITIDRYADRFGKLDSLTEPQLNALKADPITFISQKTDEHILTYKQLKDDLNDVKIQTDLLEKYQNTISKLTDSIEHTNQTLFKHNTTLETIKREKEKAINYSTNKQNNLNQELTQIRSRLSKYEQDLQAKVNERNTLSKDMAELRAKLKSTTNDFESSYKELEKLQTASLQLRSDTAKLQEAKSKIEKDKQTLFDEKESVENQRLIFLISSIVLLLGLLSYVLYGQWLVRKENQALSEEKALLEKNSEYTENFYDEYRKTTKAEIAIQREELKKQTEQLEVMLRELNHRTKNNLQMISSLLGIQAMKIDNESTKDILKNNKSRIHAIGLIHKGIYTKVFNKDIEIKMQDYIDNLINSLQKAFQLNTEVKIQKRVEDIFINPDKAIAIGLIINEVVTNTFKHAFTDHPCPQLKIKFGFNNNNKDKIYLKIEDNGKITLPIHNGNQQCPRDDAFGARFVDLWTKELEGTCLYDKTAEGSLRFILSIPNK